MTAPASPLLRRVAVGIAGLALVAGTGTGCSEDDETAATTTTADADHLVGEVDTAWNDLVEAFKADCPSVTATTVDAAAA